MTILTIDAEDFLPALEPPGFRSTEHAEVYIEKAIAAAHRQIDVIDGDTTPCPCFNAVVTAFECIVAVVRWNLDAITKDSDDAIEVFRFPIACRC